MEEKIVLASASPRRLELLRLVGVEPTVRPVNIDESLPEGLRDICDAPMLIAKRKSEACVCAPGELVIAADTIVISPDGEVMGKPKDRADASRMLHALSGRTHRVSTGFSITDGVTKISDRVVTEVTFGELLDEEIDEYLDTDEPYDKAGAYGIQGKAAVFVSDIKGDYFNVVGLPLFAIDRVIKTFFKTGRYESEGNEG